MILTYFCELSVCFILVIGMLCCCVPELIQSLFQMLYIPIVIYVPALAFSQGVS